MKTKRVKVWRLRPGMKDVLRGEIDSISCEWSSHQKLRHIWVVGFASCGLMFSKESETFEIIIEKRKK